MSEHGSVGGKDGSRLGGDGDSGQVDDEEQQRQVRCSRRHESLCWVRCVSLPFLSEVTAHLKGTPAGDNDMALLHAFLV